MTQNEFLSDWGEKFWQYQIDIGYTRKSNQLKMKADLDELLEERAVEFKNYILKNYGYYDRPITVPDEAYDTYINKQ